MLKIFAFILFALFFCTSCTVNLNTTVTVGSEDKVEADADPTQDVKPETDLSLPMGIT